jgi:hypothetical protein
MRIIIPAGTPMDRFGDTFGPLMEWFQSNGLDPAKISGAYPLELTNNAISGVVLESTQPFEYAVTVPMSEPLMGGLSGRFGGVFEGGDVRPTETYRMPVDEEAASLDDIAHMHVALRQARDAAAAAKEEADEIRDQILARLRATGKTFGSVNGARVVEMKTIE